MNAPREDVYGFKRMQVESTQGSFGKCFDARYSAAMIKQDDLEADDIDLKSLFIGDPMMGIPPPTTVNLNFVPQLKDGMPSHLDVLAGILEGKEDDRTNRHCHTLYLNDIGMDGEAFGKICKALENNTVLENLYVHCNRVEDKGALECANLMRKNSTLKRIELGSNKITSQGFEHILSALDVTIAPEFKGQKTGVALFMNRPVFTKSTQKVFLKHEKGKWQASLRKAGPWNELKEADFTNFKPTEPKESGQPYKILNVVEARLGEDVQIMGTDGTSVTFKNPVNVDSKVFVKNKQVARFKEGPYLPVEWEPQPGREELVAEEDFVIDVTTPLEKKIDEIVTIKATKNGASKGKSFKFKNPGVEGNATVECIGLFGNATDANEMLQTVAHALKLDVRQKRANQLGLVLVDSNDPEDVMDMERDDPDVQRAFLYLKYFGATKELMEEGFDEFNSMDKEGEGKVDLNELTHHFQDQAEEKGIQMDYAEAREQAKNYLKIADHAGDFVLSFEEYLTYKLYKLIDNNPDRDGYISVQELQTYAEKVLKLEGIGLEVKKKFKNVPELFRKMDRNHNQEISYAEFYDYVCDPKTIADELDHINNTNFNAKVQNPGTKGSQKQLEVKLLKEKKEEEKTQNPALN